MIGIPLGLAAANATEWLVHKYILHDRGKDRRSFWAFHWHEHHRACRRNAFYDEAYAMPVHERSAHMKEAMALGAGAAGVAPLFVVAPFFTATLWYSAANYYRVHKRSHLDPDWARAHLTWHYDHHMGPNQNANWCVTRPWFDHVLGTREPYAFTDRESRDLAAKARRHARSASSAAVGAATAVAAP